MTTTALLDRRLAADLRPPRRPKSFGAFARTLRLPDGPSAGDMWVPETEPTQSAFLSHVESNRWQIFIIVAPSQRGKTLKAILSPTLWRITECRQSVAYVLPSLDKLTQNWEGKIRPAIEGTGFGAWLPQKGPGSKGGRPAVLTLRDPESGLVANRWYFMAMGKGGNETSVSSVSPQHIAIDEGDDAVDAGQLKNTCKRIESWGRDGSAYIASTVNDRTGRESPDPSDPDAAHPILVFHKSGSRHRQHHRCPHCTGYFAPELEHIDLDRCAIVCPLCSVIWSEADRKDALNRSLSVGSNDRIADGRVIPGEYSHRIYSELTTGLDYHMGDLAAIIADIKAAKTAELRGDYSLMKTVTHKIFCRAYVEPVAATTITNKGLAENVSGRSTYDKRTVPQWVKFLTIAQDVQGDRHYWMVVGHGADDRWCVIDWGWEFLVPREKGEDEPARKPTPSDRVRVLNQIRDLSDAGWRVEGGDKIMRPVSRGVDVGYLSDQVVSWVQGEPGWKAMRGVGEDEIKDKPGAVEKLLPAEIRQTGLISVKRPSGWSVYWHRVDGPRFRRSAHAALLRDPDAPASGMIPRGLKSNDALPLHLSGEVWEEARTDKNGKHIAGFWRKAHPRWDLLDCLIYNLALALLHRFCPDSRDDSTTKPDTTAPRGDDFGNAVW